MNSKCILIQYATVVLLLGCAEPNEPRYEKSGGSDQARQQSLESTLMKNTNPTKSVSQEGGIALTNGHASEQEMASMPLYRALEELENGEEPYYRTAASRLLKQLERTGDLNEIRSWANPILSTNVTLQNTSILSPQLPSSLIKLGLGDSPVIAVVPNGKTGQPFVIVDWGGGLGHQGVAIGGREFSPENPDFYYLKWVDGIFVYHSAR